MMTTHRIVLKTHLLLTTHVRSVHWILFRSGVETTKRPGGATPHWKAREPTRESNASAYSASAPDLQGYDDESGKKDARLDMAASPRSATPRGSTQVGTT